MQEETNGKNKAPAKDFYSENRSLGNEFKVLIFRIISVIILEEEEPRKKGVENSGTKSHRSRLSDNKWSLLGVMVLIVAVLYPFKIFYE